jgi:hypothetical protein
MYEAAPIAFRSSSPCNGIICHCHARKLAGQNTVKGANLCPGKVGNEVEIKGYSKLHCPEQCENFPFNVKNKT